MPTEWIAAICMVIALVIGIVINIHLFNRAYKKNATALDIYQNAEKIQPSKGKYIISLSIYGAVLQVPSLIVLWFLPIGKEVFYLSLCFFPVILTILFFLGYPYYTLIIHDSILNGATLWGWQWKRIEINLNEIDKNKVLRQNLGGKLGIIIFESVNGAKILSLGLDNLQIRKIIEYEKGNLE